ncbi:uncharacterized protein LOC108098205 [Drosophila ficusphila]|uniref:uncharacterized protein LOC108098205 n=1 Tax=Drosophila ficusphila TaxID=30025 RepID=UPI0007E609C3|nr:uncharacterized protein LOC108098205 [Drosophila ficusphila]
MIRYNICSGLTALCPKRPKIDFKRHRDCFRLGCLSQEHHLWRQRNKVEIQHLAKLIGYCPEEIDGFLFKLSLQKYSSLLNPKGFGWNACNVPLCNPYVCDRYMGIFDHRGNLRSPIDPRSLDTLLPLLMNSLYGDSPECQKVSSICETYPFGYQAKSQSNLNTEKVKSPEKVISPAPEPSEYNFPGFLSHNVDDWVPKKIERNEFYSVIKPETILESESDESLPKKRKKRKAFGRQSVFLNDALALAYAKPSDDVKDILKTLTRHPRKVSYVGPVGNLRTERLRILLRDLIEGKGTSITKDELRRSLKKIDLERKNNAKADYLREMTTAKEISKLYNAIVQIASERPIPPVLGEVRENYPKVPVASKQRKYNGDQDPMLFYAPSDPNKSWTLERRRPKQTRLNQNFEFTSSKIKRYRRSTLRKQIADVEKRYSIHSTFSESSKSKNRASMQPLYGRSVTYT